MGGDKPDMFAWFVAGVCANVTPGFERELLCGVEDVWPNTCKAGGDVEDTFKILRGSANGRSKPARASKVELALVSFDVVPIAPHVEYAGY